MVEPFWHGADHDINAILYQAEPAETLAQLARGVADCIVTSPPPWVPEDAEHPALGSVATLDAYVGAVRRVLAEAYRVLTDDGTLWLHLTDQYLTRAPGHLSGRHARRPARRRPTRVARDRITTALPAVPLAGLPWHVAFAAADDGWTIRNAIVWHNPAAGHPMPDRLTNRYDLIFLLVKQRHYWFDHDAIPASASADSGARGRHRSAGGRGDRSSRPGIQFPRHGGNSRSSERPASSAAHVAAASPGGNPGDVWSAAGHDSPGTHLPIQIPIRCIAAGCRPGGTVLDPYAGTGTVGLAAHQLHRAFIGIESDPALCTVAKTRFIRDRAGGSGSGRGNAEDPL